MNKTELVNYVAQEAEITKKKAAEVVDAVLEGITVALNSGDKVQIMGFGAFEVRERAARKGQNPKLLKELKEQGIPLEDAKKQAEIDIPASKTVGFKAGKSLKEAVSE